MPFLFTVHAILSLLTVLASCVAAVYDRRAAAAFASIASGLGLIFLPVLAVDPLLDPQVSVCTAIFVMLTMIMLVLSVCARILEVTVRSVPFDDTSEFLGVEDALPLIPHWVAGGVRKLFSLLWGGHHAHA